MTISAAVKAKIQEDVKLRGLLMAALGVGERSITKYVEDNDVRLTAKAALIAISEYTGLAEEEILITESTTA